MSDQKFDMNNFVNFLNGKKKASGGGDRKEIEKIRYFKPIVGELNVRWLFHPSFKDSEIPAFVIYYYDNPQIFGERRAVAPFQFGKEDPIAEYVEKKRGSGKRLSEDEFKQVCRLMPKASYLIPVLVREEGSNLAQIWELNDKRFKDTALVTIAHPDYQDDLILDPVKGRDILIKGTLSDKVFQGKRTIAWTPTVRGKATKLAPTEKEAQAVIESIQDPRAVAEQYLKKPEFYHDILGTALSFFQNGGLTAGAEGTQRGGATEQRATESEKNTIESALDSAFDGDIPF